MTQPTSPHAQDPHEGSDNNALESAGLAAAAEETGVSADLQRALEQAEREMSQRAEVDDSVVAAYEAKVGELKDQLARALAETENVRKRSQRDLEESGKYVITSFARALVTVLENLQRATESISADLRAENEQVKNLAEGVEMTMRELLAIFERQGIRRIQPLGEKFDHNFHQAISQMEDNTVEAGTIMQVLQAGYVIHDRLLQPAIVVVSKKAEGEAARVDTQA